MDRDEILSVFVSIYFDLFSRIFAYFKLFKNKLFYFVCELS